MMVILFNAVPKTKRYPVHTVSSFMLDNAQLVHSSIFMNFRKNGWR